MKHLLRLIACTEAGRQTDEQTDTQMDRQTDSWLLLSRYVCSWDKVQYSAIRHSTIDHWLHEWYLLPWTADNKTGIKDIEV